MNCPDQANVFHFNGRFVNRPYRMGVKPSMRLDELPPTTPGIHCAERASSGWHRFQLSPQVSHFASCRRCSGDRAAKRRLRVSSGWIPCSSSPGKPRSVPWVVTPFGAWSRIKSDSVRSSNLRHCVCPPGEPDSVPPASGGVLQVFSESSLTEFVSNPIISNNVLYRAKRFLTRGGFAPASDWLFLPYRISTALILTWRISR